VALSARRAQSRSWQSAGACESNNTKPSVRSNPEDNIGESCFSHLLKTLSPASARSARMHDQQVLSVEQAAFGARCSGRTTRGAGLQSHHNRDEQAMKRALTAEQTW